MIKTNEIREDMSAFLEKILGGDDERLCQPDWFVHYRAWHGAFGNCQVVFYDEAASDVFGAFFKAAGLASVPNLIDVDPAQVSLNLYELAYLLEKAPIDYADFLRRKRASEKASRQSGVRDNRSALSESDLSRLRNAFEESNRRLMSSLGRSETKSPLQLDQSWNPNSYCPLPEFNISEPYVNYRKLADSIYARRNRRDRFISLFK